jgi:hypothetical protein
MKKADPGVGLCRLRRVSPWGEITFWQRWRQGLQQGRQAWPVLRAQRLQGPLVRRVLLVQLCLLSFCP